MFRGAVFSGHGVFLCYLCILCVASVLWYCWLGLLTCKNRLPDNLYCVGGDGKTLLNQLVCVCHTTVCCPYWAVSFLCESTSFESEMPRRTLRCHVMKSCYYCGRCGRVGVKGGKWCQRLLHDVGERSATGRLPAGSNARQPLQLQRARTRTADAWCQKQDLSGSVDGVCRDVKSSRP